MLRISFLIMAIIFTNEINAKFYYSSLKYDNVFINDSLKITKKSSNESDCEENIYLKQKENKKNYTYQSKNLIITSNNYQISNNKHDIEMKAGKMIVLKSYTTILKGNKYLATIKPCEDECNMAISYIPYFTPNNDGHNDYWNISKLKNEFQSIINIQIYDRYGKLLEVISSKDKGWNGTYNSKKLPSTDYWFKLLYNDCNGNLKEYISHFALRR